jgi:hypothetical protein
MLSLLPKHTSQTLAQNSITNTQRTRNWKSSARINGDSYYLCSGWYERHWDPFLRSSKKYEGEIVKR